MLKSIFISAYVPAVLAALAHTAGMLFFVERDESFNALAWWGAAVSLAPLGLFFIGLYTHPQPRTTRVLTLVFTAQLIAALLMMLSAAHSIAVLPLLYVAGLGWLGYGAYEFWYSLLGPRASRLRVGEPLPSAQLMRPDGSRIALAELQGPLVVLFYRGNWCPLCMAQIQEIARGYQTLEARGLRMVFISPQPADKTAALARRFSVPLEFYVDEGGVLARQWGIDAPAALPAGLQALGYPADAVLPTVLLTDAQHRILWLDETDHYRARPHPNRFLEAWDEHQQALRAPIVLDEARHDARHEARHEPPPF